MRATLASLAVLAATMCGCALEADDTAATTEDAVRVDTRTPEARAQYDANVAFANAYAARCASNGKRPRVLVTGFGRFMGNTDNATGRIVSAVSGVAYPETVPPPQGQVDEPAPQLAVGTTTLTLPNAGEVDVCAMILPVYWDMAAVLIAKEMNAFKPTFVMMNGIASTSQPIWIELGSVNRAAPLDDGSDQLRPMTQSGADYAPIVENASKADGARGLLLSWDAVKTAAEKVIGAHADDIDQGTRFGDVLGGAKLAGYPRSSNTYLCNNVTYVTNYLMSYPNKKVTLLRASVKKPGVPNQVDVRVTADLRATPRVFVHWPSDLAKMHTAVGAEVMRAIFDAQLTALSSGDKPTLGDNANADPSLVGGAFF